MFKIALVYIVYTICIMPETLWPLKYMTNHSKSPGVQWYVEDSASSAGAQHMNSLLSF